MTLSTAGVYARLSNDPSMKKISPEDQVAEAEVLAQRHGITVIDRYVDRDVSVSSFSKQPRPEYDRMIEDVRGGRIDTIIAYETSRLYRRMRDLEDLADLVRETGVKIKAVNVGDIDLSTGAGLTIARILASVSAGESHAISERVRRAFKHKAGRGESIANGRRPFGWAEDHKALHPTEADALREAIADVLDGVPLRAVAAEWNEKGIKPVASEAWDHRKLRPLLMRHRLAGIRTYHGEPVMDEGGAIVMGDWEPIITLDEWEALQAVLQASGRPKRQSGKHLLSAILRCGVCGGKLYGAVRAEGPNLYQCAGAVGHSVKVSAPRVDETVLAVVGRYLDELEVAPEEAAEIDPFPKQQRLDEIPGLIKGWVDGFNEGTIQQKTAFPQIQKLEDEKALLEMERREWAGQTFTRKKPSISSEQLKNLAPDRQRAVIESLVHAIVVAKAGRGGKWNPDRLSYVWRD